MQQSDLIQEIKELISNITPFDDLEQQHIKETLSWIEKKAPLFRIQKPDIPNKHLVSYFILYDESARKVLLCHHKNAELWLPTGGHVEPNEHPKETVRRECLEELGTVAKFWEESPLFLTSTPTVGKTAGHTDVSLWYVLKGNQAQFYSFDRKEFYDIAWFYLDQIPVHQCDPHMERFVRKLASIN